MTKISYAGYRFPPEIIQRASRRYFRFTLSFRDVEDLLAERGIIVSMRLFRAGSTISAQGGGLRKRRPKPRAGLASGRSLSEDQWPQVCLWRAVDAEGELFNVLVQSRRNKAGSAGD